jgi:hypothetical protein
MCANQIHQVAEHTNSGDGSAQAEGRDSAEQVDGSSIEIESQETVHMNAWMYVCTAPPGL